MNYQGKELPVTIVYKNNKHTYFRMNHLGLQVHAAKGIPKHIIEAHIQTQFNMFYEKYAKYINANQTFTLWGQNVEISFKTGQPNYKQFNNNIVIQHTTYEKGILYVLQEEMKRYLKNNEDDIQKHLKHFHVNPRSYHLKYYKSKFGAYHKVHDKIYLNIYLATQNPAYIWYVMMHEYAHTKHFHHQKSFYDFLEQLHPNYKVIEKSLKSLVIPSHFHV